MSARPEIDLLLCCARRHLTRQASARAEGLLRAGIDWDYFLSLASRHGVMPLVYRRLCDSFGANVMAEQLQGFRERYKANAAHSIFLTGELLRLLDSFERAGIEAIPYKGPALAVAVYGDVALRQFLDLDIIVRPRDVGRATEVLKRAGFAPHFALKNVREEEAFLRLSYVQLFRRAADAVAIELHWGVAPRFFNFPFPIERLWEHNTHLSLGGSEVRAIAPETLLLLLSVHGNKDLWARLEWVCGLDALINRETDLDWQAVLTEALRLGALRILLLGLALSSELLDTPLPEEVSRRVAGSTAVASLASLVRRTMFDEEARVPTLREQVSFHTRSKDTLGARLTYCSRLLLTTTPVDWSAVGVPPSFSFVHLLVRPLRLMKKRLLSPARRAS
ncbi:MAG: nucleotidyltransferase family protein [Pyrinomonadaceae bacterium]